MCVGRECLRAVTEGRQVEEYNSAVMPAFAAHFGHKSILPISTALALGYLAFQDDDDRLSNPKEVNPPFAMSTTHRRVESLFVS